jgi:hypothetical protein
VPEQDSSTHTIPHKLVESSVNAEPLRLVQILTLSICSLVTRVILVRRVGMEVTRDRAGMPSSGLGVDVMRCLAFLYFFLGNVNTRGLVK